MLSRGAYVAPGRPTPRVRHRGAYGETGVREHRDEAVHAEPFDASSEEVVHARLAHAEQLGCLALRELTALEDALDDQRELRPEQEPRCLGPAKARIQKDIAR